MGNGPTTLQTKVGRKKTRSEQKEKESHRKSAKGVDILDGSSFQYPTPLI